MVRRGLGGGFGCGNTSDAILGPRIDVKVLVVVCGFFVAPNDFGSYHTWVADLPRVYGGQLAGSQDDVQVPLGTDVRGRHGIGTPRAAQ